MMSPRSQLTPSAAGQVSETMLRQLRRSRTLRKVYNALKNNLSSDAALLQRRLVPEAAFSEKLRETLFGLIARHGAAGIGDYLEFGVYNGTSLSCAYQVFGELGLDQARFFGFDSFQGLPPEAERDDDGTFLPHQFACRLEVTEQLLRERGVDPQRSVLVKGWFKDTLVPATLQAHGLRKASVVMIDCDIYSSALTGLRFVRPLIVDEAIVVFDDWFSFGLAQRDMGEARAFREFLQESPELEAEELGGYNEHSLLFSVVRRPEVQ